MNKNKMTNSELGQWTDDNLNKGVEYDEPTEYWEELSRTYFNDDYVKVVRAWFKVIDGKLSLREYKEEESEFDYNVDPNDLKENWEYEVDKGELFVLAEGVIPLGRLTGNEIVDAGGTYKNLEENDLPDEVLDELFANIGLSYDDLEFYDGYQQDVMREWEKLSS